MLSPGAEAPTPPYTVATAIVESYAYTRQLHEFFNMLNETLWDLLPDDFERLSMILNSLATRIDFLFDKAASAFLDDAQDHQSELPSGMEVAVTRTVETWATIGAITAWPPSTVRECEAVTELIRTARRALRDLGSANEEPELSPPG